MLFFEQIALALLLSQEVALVHLGLPQLFVCRSSFRSEKPPEDSTHTPVGTDFGYDAFDAVSVKVGCVLNVDGDVFAFVDPIKP